MASIRKLPNTKYWIACYTSHTGKRKQRSTKETNRRKAQKRAEEYEAAYRKLISEAQARRVLSDIYQEIHGEKLASSSVRGVLESWLKGRSVETSPATASRYQTAVKHFLGFLGEKGEKDLAFITTNDLAAFRNDLADRLSSSSANTNLKIIRTALQDALRQDLLIRNPAALVNTIKTKQNRRRAFTLPELKKLLDNASEEWRGIIPGGDLHWPASR